ncbi:unnamed protein product [Paramecium sonneborni]|uniref:Uncharacterized protein n=1 Tax=Paramecium sonneborni TaxID=65129 RepID=A0A8S1P275_9CILI|nr:unnamed protein product [Paramecium sonneborni]
MLRILKNDSLRIRFKTAFTYLNFIVLRIGSIIKLEQFLKNICNCGGIQILVILHHKKYKQSNNQGYQNQLCIQFRYLLIILNNIFIVIFLQQNTQKILSVISQIFTKMVQVILLKSFCIRNQNQLSQPQFNCEQVNQYQTIFNQLTFI